ncbi:uncharacterized protein [Procambarus clarkii]|uniref:uncharacterized protein isoform X2 n=1 Tax=Procambarus clarkii TaxID=6728 RepID=UPI003743B690
MTAAVAGVAGGSLGGMVETHQEGGGGGATEGVTPLMFACQQSRDHTVRQILHRKPASVQERDRTGKTALHYCAENPTLSCIDQVVEADPSLLKARDEDGYTPLHLATIAGNRAVVKYLLTKGADVKSLDNEKHTAVHWATVCGEVDILDLLIDAGGDPSTPDIHGAYPLHYAAQMCGPNSEMGNDVRVGLMVLRKLLQRGVDVSVTDHDGRQPLLWAASAGSADAILALVNAGGSVSAEDKDGLTALHCAASRGHLDCLDCLVNFCGAEVDTLDSNGCTPLFYAVTLGHADCTQLLLHHGAHPDKQDRKGRTPAHCGAAKGQLETLKLLHRKGADLWKRNVKGDLPLHEACQSGRKDLVLWLLSMKPDTVNAPNLDGRCPLHIAAINNNIEMCKILMDKQAAVNPIMRNSRGQLLTPLDAAIARSNRGCAKYLQLHGGVAASKLTDKHALQKAMQRALETSEQGRTGVTPGEYTGDELMSSSASSVLKSNMSTMTASPVNIEAQTDTGDYKEGKEGEKLLHKDAQTGTSEVNIRKLVLEEEAAELAKRQAEQRIAEERDEGDEVEDEQQEAAKGSVKKEDSQLEGREAADGDEIQEGKNRSSAAGGGSGDGAEEIEEKDGESTKASRRGSESAENTVDGNNRENEEQRKKDSAATKQEETLQNTSLRSTSEGVEEHAKSEAGEQGATIDGGEQGATIDGGEPGAIIDGGEQGATIDGGEQGATIDGGEQSATIDGGEQSATIDGGEQGATIDGGEQGATIDGGDQGATIDGGEQSATIDGGEQDVTIDGGEQSATIDGDEEGATIDGGEQRATIDEGVQSASGEEAGQGASSEDTKDKEETNENENNKKISSRKKSKKALNKRSREGEAGENIVNEEETEEKRPEEETGGKEGWEADATGSTSANHSGAGSDEEELGEQEKGSSEMDEGVENGKENDEGSSSKAMIKSSVRSKKGEGSTKTSTLNAKGKSNQATKGSKGNSKQQNNAKNTKGSTRKVGVIKRAGKGRTVDGSREKGTSGAAGKKTASSDAYNPGSSTEEGQEGNSKSRKNKLLETGEITNDDDGEDEESGEAESENVESDGRQFDGVDEGGDKVTNENYDNFGGSGEAGDEGLEGEDEDGETVQPRVRAAGSRVRPKSAIRPGILSTKAGSRKGGAGKSKQVSSKTRSKNESRAQRRNLTRRVSISENPLRVGGQRDDTHGEGAGAPMTALEERTHEMMLRTSGREFLTVDAAPPQLSSPSSIHGRDTGDSGYKESGLSDTLGAEQDSDVYDQTDPERQTDDEDPQKTSRRKTKTRRRRNKQREGHGGPAGDKDEDYDGVDGEDEEDDRRLRRRRDAKNWQEDTGGGRGGDKGRESGKGSARGGIDDDIPATTEGDDYDDADEDALDKLGVPTHRRPGVRRGQVSSGALSGGPKKVENMESNLRRRARKAASPSTEVSITQAMQNAMRKYALERRLFQQLLELKRIQIRNTRANEHVMIKRMVDAFQKEGHLLGIRGYGGPYNFNSYEKYLYDQLRYLQSSQSTKIPAFRPTDDVDRLSRAIRRAELRELPEPLMTSRDASVCNHTTHRCHHAAHAYTGVPCAAYIGYRGRKRAPVTSTNTKQVSLPRIAGTSNTSSGGGGTLAGSPRPAHDTVQTWSKPGEPVGLRNYDPKKPLTVELQHGLARQQIILPTETLDKNKKYHLTFSIKPSTPVPGQQQSTRESVTGSPERSASAPETLNSEGTAEEPRQELHSAPPEGRTEP